MLRPDSSWAGRVTSDFIRGVGVTRFIRDGHIDHATVGPNIILVFIRRNICANFATFLHTGRDSGNACGNSDGQCMDAIYPRFLVLLKFILLLKIAGGDRFGPGTLPNARTYSYVM